MKKPILFFIFFFIISTNLFSQTFEKLIKTNANDYAIDAIELNNGNFVIGYNKISNENNYKSEILILNNKGEIIQSISLPDYKDITEEIIAKIFSIDSSTFVGIRAVKNNNGINQNNILKFKKVLNKFNLVSDTIVGIPNISISDFDFILTSDTNILSVGIINNQYYTAFIYETDINGNYINSKLYYNTLGNITTTIMEIPEKNEYHMFESWDNNRSFYKIDKQNLEIKDTLYYPNSFIPRNAIKGINENSYFVSGRSIFSSTVIYIPAYVEINNEGEILNIHEYLVNKDTNSFYTTNCFDHLNGKIYFGAVYNFTTDPLFYCAPEQRYIFINKLNSDGSIIWQRFYKGEVNYMPFKVLATKDGGALILSTKYDWGDPISNQFDLHILKVDSNGWYDGIYNGNNEIIKPPQILAYPNPIIDKVYFEIGLYKNLDLKIFNISGKLVKSTFLKTSETINLSQLQKGLYVYVLSNDKGFVEKGKIIKK